MNAASLLFAKETCKQLYQPLVIKRKLSDNELISLVNIELHGAVVTHLQQERLAVVLMLYVHALHDFENLQRLFAKGITIFSRSVIGVPCISIGDGTRCTERLQRVRSLDEVRSGSNSEVAALRQDVCFAPLF